MMSPGRDGSMANILLDTGCSRTLIHRKHVPVEKMLDGEVVAIQCAHGDTVLYPMAELEVEVEGHLCKMQAAIGCHTQCC